MNFFFDEKLCAGISKKNEKNVTLVFSLLQYSGLCYGKLCVLQYDS
jgi:hypothetical protein